MVSALVPTSTSLNELDEVKPNLPMLLLITMFTTTESKPGHFSKCYIRMEWRGGLSISLFSRMRWDSS